MTKPFENLDKKKQKRIIDAALKEFSVRGFEDASTNNIVKEAGIGKGMLFYYFKNKEGLNAYLIKYCLEIMEEKFLGEIDADEPDLFERMKQIVRIKMDFLSNYPDVMNFIGTTVLNNQIEEEWKSRIVELQEVGYAKIYGNIDYALFKEEMDVQQVLNLIRWTIEGYENELKRRLQGQDLISVDYSIYIEEFFSYLDMMRTWFYK